MIENEDEAFADNYAERDQARVLREQARAGGRFEGRAAPAAALGTACLAT